MAADNMYEGWVGDDASSANGNMIWKQYVPKAWEETDIEIKITHSGVCGSDLHTLRSGWREAPYPIVVGHEIVGVAIRVGSEAEGNINVGDVVGVGPQSDSCLNRDADYRCAECAAQCENYCRRRIGTYASKHRNGSKTQGGYALYHRAPSHFVVKIPDGLAPELAAPMLCAGVTVYSPLKRYGAGPDKSVGVIGLGGLGHFAVLFAKALGAREVVGISRREDKRTDAVDLGCDDYIATGDEEDWAVKHSRRFDIIINTVASVKMPFAEYLGLLTLDGTLVQVGLPEGPILFRPSGLGLTRSRVAGTYIGSPSEIREMLQVAVEKGVKPWVQQRPMKDANTAILDFEAGKPRFRYVLVN
ncbi:NADP-dependent alcohol dehydrogenase [Purpureocillium lavendulum]|uniref:alcohol dehydrogenase (NADP(+)) n=1 Tax=Purpureocillium lavendulum TaxID=1247861 RepID=A0AB34FQ32_9HYPO|nr:NADP-dependent alcohol dehydrogenase [Purpureocillium lavendulum]